MGDGSKDPVTITGDNLSEFKELLQAGADYSEGKELRTIEKVLFFFF